MGKILVALFILLAGWLWLGVYTDREFATHHLFVKHRPTYLFWFRPAYGEPEKTAGHLSESEMAEERGYREFVEEHNGFRRSVYLFF